MYRLLICDDENYILDMLNHNVDWAKYDIEVADVAVNGQQGLNKFNTAQIDIVLTDIRMPVMSGIEMARKIRAQNQNVQIIFLTSYDEFEYAKSAITINACGYVVKPLDENDLDQALRAAVNRLNMAQPQPQSEEESEGTLLIESINAYVKDNIRKKITLKEISEYLGYSPNYIGQLYKKTTGVYLTDYIIQVKMEYAKKLLRISQNQVGTVATMLGYADQAYFIRQFKESYGVTPKTFRDNIKNFEK